MDKLTALSKILAQHNVPYIIAYSKDMSTIRDTKELTSASLRRLINSKQAYAILDSTVGGTWLEGGCALLALALSQLGFGVLTVLIGRNRGQSESQVQHWLVKTSQGTYLDGDGVSSERSLLRRWKNDESIDDISLRPAVNSDKIGETWKSATYKKELMQLKDLLNSLRKSQQPKVATALSADLICVEAKYSRENDFLRNALAERDLKHDTFIIHEYGPANLYFDYLRDNNEEEYQNLVDATGNEEPDTHDLFDAIIGGDYKPTPGAIEDFLENTSEYTLEGALRQDDDGNSSLIFSLNNKGKLLPRNTWVGHFCSDAYAIASKGFLYGESDAYSLGLTKHKSEQSRHRAAGYNFGFELNEMHKNWQSYSDTKYGNELVLFQTSGVSAFHYGDEEDQVIFWGPQVEWVVPIVPATIEDEDHHSEDDYAVLATDGSYAFRTSSNVESSATYNFSQEENCIACAKWVVKNINAYRKSIVWHLPKGIK